MNNEGLPIWVEHRGYSSHCWIWLEQIGQHGYGVMSIKGKTITAHRWMYLRVHGHIPDKYHVDHLCRVRACVNPDHLEAVTHKENVHRGAITKISFPDIQVMRAAYKEGMGQKELALMFGLESSNVSRIVNYKARIDS